eukprot:TRINITY_DN38514_c0_g1_i1.p1 TRINITY_DN38514_c0_g1~~TRINITY_DN38514_c0_g1_i1.p1  ORF type:complete len:363 (+),score=65.91 TRINITY_DN38514_c0_g1_i1:120-1091(+)
MASRIVETVLVGTIYILVSAALIGFNKYLMHEGRFPHAMALTCMHMLSSGVFSVVFYSLRPELYTSAPQAKANLGRVLRFMVPLALLFAYGLWASNRAYFFCSVAFLQFCKQSNVVWMFLMACAAGLQQFQASKMAILLVVISGCSLCVHGEVNFSLLGFLLQISSQTCELTKNLLSEVVMGGELRLDPLTFVGFQTVLSFVPLSAALAYSWTPEISKDFLAMRHILLLNSFLAFALNVALATVVKRLSALSLVLAGVVKDVFIVASSVLILGDPISIQQMVGAIVALLGLGLWSHLKLREQAKNDEKQLLLPGCKHVSASKI